MKAELFAAILLGACGVESPSTTSPPDVGRDAGGRVFADTLIAFSAGAKITTCLATFPPCDGSLAAGECPSSPLGANDDDAFELGPGGRIELALRCSAILEHGSTDGTASPDFKIWSTVAPGARAIVEVSIDGKSYDSLGFLEISDSTFDLARLSVDAVRFVRITDSGQGGVAIDAVEAL